MRYFVLFAFLSLASVAYGEKAIAGRIVITAGQVTVAGKAVQPGEMLFAGDEVRTLENSSAKLLLAERSIVDVGPSSSFKVTALKVEGDSRNVDTQLDFGAVRANVSKKLDSKSRFFIRTRTSVLAVRGTEVVASWSTEGGTVREAFTVASGKVDVLSGAAGGTSLAAGQQLSVAGNFQNGTLTPVSGTKPQPMNVAAPQLTQVMTQARVENNTFVESIAVSGTGGRGSETLGTIAKSLRAENDRRPAGGFSLVDIAASLPSTGDMRIPGLGTYIPPVFSPSPGNIASFAVTLTLVLESA